MSLGPYFGTPRDPRQAMSYALPGMMSLVSSYFRSPTKGLYGLTELGAGFGSLASTAETLARNLHRQGRTDEALGALATAFVPAEFCASTHGDQTVVADAGNARMQLAKIAADFGGVAGMDAVDAAVQALAAAHSVRAAQTVAVVDVEALLPQARAAAAGASSKKGHKVGVTPTHAGIVSAIAEAGERRRVFMAATAGDEELLRLGNALVRERRNVARAAGRSCYFDFVFGEGAYAAAVSTVRETLARSERAARRELLTLASAKRAREGGSDLPEPWDLGFYQRLQCVEGGADADPSLPSPYLALGHVVEAFDAFLQHTFDVSLELREMAAGEAWAPSVRKLRVLRGDTPVGDVYLDALQRPGKSLDEFCGYVTAAHVTGGLPQAGIVLNVALDPAGPALLSYADLTAFLHEFGHALRLIEAPMPAHVLLARHPASYSREETIAHVFERFAASFDVVRLFARHVDSGQPISRPHFDRWLASARRYEALNVQALGQRALFDLRVHGPDDISLSAAFDEASSATVIPTAPGTHPYLWDRVFLLQGGTIHSYTSANISASVVYDKYFGHNVAKSKAKAFYHDFIQQ